MNWRIKGVAQRVLSAVPGGRTVNGCLQRTLGSLRDFEYHVDCKVTGDWLVFAEYLRELGLRASGRDFLEIGTGWHPTLPVCFYLAGARSCQSFDLTRHLQWGMTARMVRRLEVHLPAIAASSGRTPAEVEAAYKRLLPCRSLDELLHQINLRYAAPADARHTGLPEGSVDVAFSNSVLEHVPPDVILGLMRETRRVLRPGGIGMHGANCGDHYAYFDKNITMLNYLQYSHDEWRVWNNDLLYQNRLRPCDFVRLAEEAGLNTVFARSQPAPELLECLPGLTLSSEFAAYPPEQLCATSLGLVSQAR
jgi:SAM-dependent methyltransferase